MNFNSAKKILNNLYKDIDGYHISAEAKKKLNYTDKTLTYGEIQYESFYEILKRAEPKSGEFFYDLGSGSGKAVISAALLFPFAKSVGIEILDDLFHSSNKTLKKLNLMLRASMFINFIKTNFFSFNFSDADIIFAHCTCLPDQLMIPLSNKLNSLKKGARVITVTKTIFNEKFIRKDIKDYKMGWGTASVNFYEKIS